MGKIAYVFSGQGDQYPGMGKPLFEEYTAARKIFELCDQLRPGTSKQCFEGTEEELKETKNTQPCLLAMELAAAAVLNENGIKPDAVAGFSLGEVAASVAAGVFDIETGFQLVCKRGELMQQAAEKQDARMAAVVRLSAEKVEELCQHYSNIYPVNFNCPGQITVAGLAEEMPAFSAEVKNAGGRALPLKVKGGFHSPFMKKAAELFAQELEKVEAKIPEVELYSNKTANPYTEDIKGLLAQQICNPVKWEDTIRNMIDSGIDTFIEIGPGKTLINMIKKIDTEVRTYSISELSEMLQDIKGL